MKLLLPLCASVLLGLAAFAQAAPPSGADTGTRYTLSGTVVNSVTGEPIRRALVQIFMAGQQAVLTDASGHFEFNDLPPGQTAVSVRKPGFFTDQDLNAAQFGPPLASVGPNAPSLVIKMFPDAVIAGRVESREGEPLQNVIVRLIRLNIVNGRRQWNQAGGTNTNEDGEYRMGSLMPGWYYVVAGPSSETVWLGSPGTKGREGTFPEVFYPGARDLSSATSIQLAPGQQVEANISIAAEPVYRVSGAVEGVGESQGMNIEFATESGDPVPIPTEYGENGKFDARVPAGNYVLKTTAFGQGPPMTGSLKLSVNGDLSGIRVPLAPVSTIPVRALFETTRSNRSRVAANTNTIMIHLNRVDVSFGGGDEYLSLGGSPDPAANSIHDLSPGRYSLEVTSPNPGWYVRSARCGGTDLLRDDLVVASGARLPAIEIVLRDDGGSLSGMALSGGLPSRAAVIAVPDSAPKMAKMTYVGPDGRFNFGKLAPGDYSVLAVDRTDGLEYGSPEVLAPYLSSATHVAVSPDGDADVNVNVVTMGR